VGVEPDGVQGVIGLFTRGAPAHGRSATRKSLVQGRGRYKEGERRQRRQLYTSLAAADFALAPRAVKTLHRDGARLSGNCFDNFFELRRDLSRKRPPPNNAPAAASLFSASSISSTVSSPSLP